MALAKTVDPLDYLKLGGSAARKWVSKEAGMNLEDWPEETKPYRKAVEDIPQEDIDALDAEEAQSADPDEPVEEIGEADDNIRENEPKTPAARMMRDLFKVLKKNQRKVINALPESKAITKRAVSSADMKKAQSALKQLQKELNEILDKHLPKIASMGAVTGYDRISIDAKIDELPPSIAAQARQISKLLAEAIAQTTADGITAILSRTIEQGRTTAQAAKEIRESYSFSAQRSETIARTESARAFLDGQEDAWKEAGIKEKRFLLAPDACPFCRQYAQLLEDKTTSMGEPFFKDGTVIRGIDGSGKMKVKNISASGVPVHPRCRCDVVPVV